MSGKVNQNVISEVSEHEIHKTLDQLFEICYIDALTGFFRCKKCNSKVNIDLSRLYVYCPNHGMIL